MLWPRACEPLREGRTSVGSEEEEDEEEEEKEGGRKTFYDSV